MFCKNIQDHRVSSDHRKLPVDTLGIDYLDLVMSCIKMPFFYTIEISSCVVGLLCLLTSWFNFGGLAESRREEQERREEKRKEKKRKEKKRKEKKRKVVMVKW